MVSRAPKPPGLLAHCWQIARLSSPLTLCRCHIGPPCRLPARLACCVDALRPGATRPACARPAALLARRWAALPLGTPHPHHIATQRRGGRAALGGAARRRGSVVQVRVYGRPKKAVCQLSQKILTPKTQYDNCINFPAAKNQDCKVIYYLTLL